MPVKWSSILFEVPEDMILVTSKGAKLHKTLTKSGGITKRVGFPSVQFKTSPTQVGRLIKSGVHIEQSKINKINQNAKKRRRKT